MKIPTAATYLSLNGPSLRKAQEMLVSTSSERLRGSVDFRDMQNRVYEVATAMQKAGYGFEFLDEDGESMIAYGGSLGKAFSITVQAHWDDEDGALIAWTFRDGADYVVLAEVGDSVVEAERGLASAD